MAWSETSAPVPKSHCQETAPGLVLVDGNRDPGMDRPTRTVVGGDRLHAEISAASILAKVTRDRIMRTEAKHYPAYAFEGNKGYPGPVHKAALHALGPSTIHRRSWVFMDGLAWGGIKRYRRPEPQQRLFD